MCGTDLALQTGHMPFAMPLLLGHEASGRVLAVGEDGLDGPAVGDRVVLWMRPPCRACRLCVRGQAGLCERNGFMSARGTLLDGRTSCTRGGQPLYRALGIGAFTEQVVMPVAGLVPVPDDVPVEVAALLGCGVATGAGAILNVAKPEPGDVVLIFGAGGVGQAAAMAASAVGAGRVIVVDPAPHRREQALDLGATDVVEGGDRDTLRAQLAALPGARAGRPGSGARARGLVVDVAIDAVGRPELVELAYRTVRQGGTVVAVGVAPGDAHVTLPAAALALSQKRLLGCFMGGIDPQRDLPRLFDLWRRGALPVDRLVADRRPLEEAGAALADLAAARGLRTILEVNEISA